MAFLGVDAQGCDRPCFESHQTDRLASFFAIAVAAILKTRQRSVDLGNQLTLTITRAKFHPAIDLRARSICKVGMLGSLFMQVL